MTAIRSMLDHPELAIGDYEKSIINHARQFGWHATSVYRDEECPGFTYSVGFWRKVGIPEVIVFGLPIENAHGLLWRVFRNAEAGVEPTVGDANSNVAEGFDSYFFPLGPEYYSTYPRSAEWFYCGETFPCLVLVWPDPSGLFPWQTGFDEKFREDQPEVVAGGWPKPTH